MVNLQPFFLLLLAHWFIPGDRITKKKVLGLIMGAGGDGPGFFREERALPPMFSWVI